MTTVRNLLAYPVRKMRDSHVDSALEWGMNIGYNRLEVLLSRLA